jgi:plasmid stabilization system protein ParE
VPRVIKRPAAKRDLVLHFAGVRMWRVRGFENFLIFYTPRKDGVAVERVIHAAQDYQRVLR